MVGLGQEKHPLRGHRREGTTAVPGEQQRPGRNLLVPGKRLVWIEGMRPKTAKQVLDLLITVNCRSSYFLLNGGPNKQGQFEEASAKVLAEAGKLRSKAGENPAK